MNFAPGTTQKSKRFELDDPLRDQKVQSYVDTLAKIHGLDWQAIKLDQILLPPTPEDCPKVWLQFVLARMEKLGFVDDKNAKRAVAWLSERMPKQSEIGLIHGDTNLANYRFQDGAVVAVLDWEAAMLSDPLADLGQACGSLRRWMVDQPTNIQQREMETLLGLYQDATGRSFEHLPFWEVMFTLRAALNSNHPAKSPAVRTPLYWEQLKLLTA